MVSVRFDERSKGRLGIRQQTPLQFDRRRPAGLGDQDQGPFVAQDIADVGRDLGILVEEVEVFEGRFEVFVEPPPESAARNSR